MCKKWKVFIMVFCLIFTMMPVAAFADQTDETQGTEETQVTEETTLTIKYLDKNESGSAAEIQIKSVSYIDNPNGVQVTNPYTISIDDEIFGDQEHVVFDAMNYVPDLITDMNDVIWELNDKGDGQQTINIQKGTNIHKFHYKKIKSDPQEVTQGGITIVKDITGDTPGIAETFTFAITGPDDYSGEASITGEGETSLSNLAPGTYTVTEGKVDNYVPKQNDLVVTVSAGAVAIASFENVYTKPDNPPSATSGSITIKKEITGDVPETDDVFTFTVTMSDAYSNTVTITGEGVTTISGLIPGSYTVTEAFVDNYEAEKNTQTAEVTAGNDTPLEFTNIYTDPEAGPRAYINKTVALYDGVNIPNDSAFASSLNLTELNKTVIFKIDLSCNSLWIRSEKAAGLFDIYNDDDITGDLLVSSGGVLCKAVDDDLDYPDYLWLGKGKTYYYIDTLTSNGTYTNTANLYESYYYKTASETLQYPDPIASSSAVVVVNYTPATNNGDGGSSHSHSYYYVTYNANFPVSTGTSGTVPVDNSKYSKGNTVTVKDNAGDLKVGDYTFEGWNTKADGTGTAYDPGDTFKISSSVTLYAQWENGDAPLPSDNDDNEAVTSSEVVPANQLDDIPKTGDSTPVLPMLLLGFFSLAAIALLGRKNAADTAAK